MTILVKSQTLLMSPLFYAISKLKKYHSVREEQLKVLKIECGAHKEKKKQLITIVFWKIWKLGKF